MCGELLHFIHTPEFDESLSDIPISDDELRAVQQQLQSDPEAGDVIPGTGGVRKLRASVKAKGKRGGARILYYCAIKRWTVYLLLAYDKSETDNVSAAGKKVLRQLAARLEAEKPTSRDQARDC